MESVRWTLSDLNARSAGHGLAIEAGRHVAVVVVGQHLDHPAAAVDLFGRMVWAGAQVGVIAHMAVGGHGSGRIVGEGLVEGLDTWAKLATQRVQLGIL